MYGNLLENVAEFINVHTRGEQRGLLPRCSWIYEGPKQKYCVFLRCTRRVIEHNRRSEGMSYATLEIGNIGNPDSEKLGGRQSMFLSVLRLLEEQTRYVTYIENVQEPRLQPIMPRLGYQLLVTMDAHWDLVSPTFYKINGDKKDLITF